MVYPIPTEKHTPMAPLTDKLMPSNPYIQAATRDATRRAYRSDIQAFVNWGGLLPITSDIIIAYLQAEAAHLNPRTLSRRLTAIKNWHLYQGFQDPTAHPGVRKTLTGIYQVHGKPKMQAPALRLETLQQLVNSMQAENSVAMCRNNALLQIGFFAALRCSELIAIQYEHLRFVPEGIEILIPRSKTDAQREGQVCAVPYGDKKLCAVRALQQWCEEANISTGYIFRRIDKHGNVGTKPLTAKSVSLILKKLALACQLSEAEQYSSHSLRRGFATSASRKGVPFTAIMRQGRWRHEGTVLSYIEEGQRFEENAAKLLLQGEN